MEVSKCCNTDRNTSTSTSNFLKFANIRNHKFENIEKSLSQAYIQIKLPSLTYLTYLSQTKARSHPKFSRLIFLDINPLIRPFSVTFLLPPGIKRLKFSAIFSPNQKPITNVQKITTYWFQCSFEIRYKHENIIGKITFEFSSMRLMIYSLFQKYNALSATWISNK